MTFRLPRSLMKTRRKEIEDQLLNIIEGELPDQIFGFAYFMVPAGDCEDGHESKAGSPILGGDGLLLRLDFSQKGKVIFSSKFPKSESSLVDNATWHKESDRPDDNSNVTQGKIRINPFKKWKFKDFGLGRLNFGLGLRNSLNTAIIPLKFREDPHSRLLVCSDDGRPYEMDPFSLETVTPVGSLKEWKSVMGNGIKLFGKRYGVWTFPLNMSTAHPVMDPKTSELFTVNYGRSFRDTIHNSSVFNQRVTNLSELFRLFVSKFFKAVGFFILGVIFWFVDTFFGNFIHGNEKKKFTHLMRWDGKGNLKKYALVLPEGKPVLIRETLHQVAVTANHIIFIDASFKFTIDQIVNSIRPFRQKDNKASEIIERIVRHFITAPMDTDTGFYFLRRKDLDNTPIELQQKIDSKKRRYNNLIQGCDRLVEVKKITLPFETMHFMADYKEEDGKITLHLAHNNAACVSEWLRKYDYQYTGKKSSFWKVIFRKEKKPVEKDLIGMMAVGQMDVSRIQKVVIEPETSSCEMSLAILSIGNIPTRGQNHDTANQSQVYKKETIPNTFNLSFYAYKGQTPTDAIPEKIDQIYWMCGGLFPEALTEFIHRMYKRYQHRTIPLELFEQISAIGKPSNLIRVNTRTMEINDFYIFDLNVVGMSPIFISKSDQNFGQMDGFILTTVYFDSPNNEIPSSQFWIFDASNLQKGPICKLGHKDVVFGLSLHTAWDNEAKPRPKDAYKVDLRMDLEDRLKSKDNPKIEKMFEEHVFSYYENQN